MDSVISSDVNRALDSDEQDVIARSSEAVDQYRRLQRLGMIDTQDRFFPSLLYPPLKSYPPMTAESLYHAHRPPPDGLYNVYAHIPFCLRQCTFCHIPVAIGSSSDDKARYIGLLDREMDLVMGRLGLGRIPTTAVLLGGGTPTNLPPDLLDAFLTRLTARLDLSRCTQISVDLDPTTLLGPAGAERLDILCKHGVSRLAFGVQSMTDDVLAHMHRPHDSAGVVEAIARSKARGLKINIELLFGYPNETLESWTRTVTRAIGLGVDEVQIYRLHVIPYRERAGVITSMDSHSFPPVEETMRMQKVATDLLQRHGYNENMRRFFTRTPQDYSHYFFNWTSRLQDQIGFGQTAFSYFRDRYGQNALDLARYEAEVAEGRIPIERGIIRDEDTQLRWAFCLPLRYFEATDEVFRAATGRGLDEVFVGRVAQLEEHGLLERTPRGLRLTPWGSFFADELTQLFHHPQYRPFPPSAYLDGPLHPMRDNQPL